MSNIEPIATEPVPRVTLRREEVAVALGVSVKTVDRMDADENGPPFFRIGKTKFYPVEQLRRWAAARVEEGQSQ